MAVNVADLKAEIGAVLKTLSDVVEGAEEFAPFLAKIPGLSGIAPALAEADKVLKAVEAFLNA